MDITPFSDFTFDNKDAWSDFLLVNGIQHERYTFELQSRGYGPATSDIIDVETDTKEGVRDWMLAHYQAHQFLADAFGLPEVSNLVDVELHDDDQMLVWLQLHAQQHQIIDAILNV